MDGGRRGVGSAILESCEFAVEPFKFGACVFELCALMLKFGALTQQAKDRGLGVFIHQAPNLCARERIGA